MVKSAKLVLGLLIGKVRLGLSDVEILEYFYENPYFQYFCGYDTFVSKITKVMDPSLLTKRRNKLGAEYFLKFESEILEVLKDKRFVKGKELLLDGTVFESKIEYPNDVKLLNTVRSYAIKQIDSCSSASFLQNLNILISFRKVCIIRNCIAQTPSCTSKSHTSYCLYRSVCLFIIFWFRFFYATS